ncbi:MAG: hypothetical protein QM756_26640 [Polyangiaceae bacterium]
MNPVGARPAGVGAALRAHGGSWMLALGLLSCRARPSGDEPPVTRLRAISVPVSDPSPLCADVADARVCWSNDPAASKWVGERTLPGPGASDTGKYRCTGGGDARLCRLRSELSPPFRCHGARCVQVLPRVPDDGEWECADLGGMVLCRGGTSPAGVTRPGSDPGWWCGARRRSSSAERICLDPDPDYPRARVGHFRCRYEHDGARLTRLCEPSEQPVVGSRCRDESACPADTRCRGGVCLPESFSPNCWGDADCANGRCALGVCSARSSP